MPEGKERRRSLVAGEARRERFQHSREGTGRVPTVRPLNAAGFGTEKHGLVDLHQMFSFSPGTTKLSDLEYELSEAGTPGSVRMSTELFHGTPSSQSYDASSSEEENDTPLKNTTNQRRSSRGDKDEMDMKHNRENITSPSPAKGKGKQHLADVMSPSPAKDKGKQAFAVPTPRARKSPPASPASPAPPPAPTPAKKNKQKKSSQNNKKQQNIPLSEIENISFDDNVPSSPEDYSVPSPAQPSPAVSKNNRKKSISTKTPAAVEKKTVDKSKQWKTPANQTTSRTQQKYKNNTGGLIEEAKDTGFLADIQQAAKEQQKQGVRRSTRQKWAPMDEWRNEYVVYSRAAEGAGAVMPTVSKIATPTKFDNVFERKRPAYKRKNPEAKEEKHEDTKEDKQEDTKEEKHEDTKKAKKGGQKKEKKHKIEKKQSPSVQFNDVPEVPGDMQYSDDDYEAGDVVVPRAPLDPTCKVRNKHSNKLHMAVVAKSQEMVSLEPLVPAIASDEPKLDRARLPQGGKMFEENDFSSGILKLPPMAVKHFEMATQSETFYVAKCATNALEFRINRSKMKLSQGDSFTIPASNVYYLKNLSQTKPALLYFVLVKHPVPSQ